nr:putative integron gene cassette protein [uncultured bacterium]
MSYQQFVDLFSALLTPVIAISMLYIAYQQWQTNRIKLRKELYDQRLLIYTSTIELIYTIQSLGHANHEQHLKFSRETSNSVFLFGKEVNQHLKERNDKTPRLRHTSESIQRLSKNPDKNSKKLGELADLESEIFNWFVKQPNIVETKFKKYLDLSTK